jgi:hypothetical protein
VEVVGEEAVAKVQGVGVEIPTWFKLSITARLPTMRVTRKWFTKYLFAF